MLDQFLLDQYLLDQQALLAYDGPDTCASCGFADREPHSEDRVVEQTIVALDARTGTLARWPVLRVPPPLQPACAPRRLRKAPVNLRTCVAECRVGCRLPASFKQG